MRTITRSLNSRLLLTLLLCSMFLLSTVAALGQSTTQGAIGGTVVDPQNKVVIGATVAIKNLGSNFITTVKTDAQGYYRAGQLEPATYSVSVKAEGFAPFRAENVIVTVGSLTSVSPHLTIGTTEQVDVSAESPLINVTSADFAPTLNETAVQNLPINGGRWSSFVMLTPGVVSDANGFGLVSFRGMSTLLNNVTVDGADNNQAYFSEERGRTRAGYSTAKAAVQEFQVNTSNYSAEYGRSAGGVVNTVTKSGTNKLHGEGFFYDRDNNWGAFNPYTTLASFNSSTQAVTISPYKPVDVRKMGGFDLGGPIIKDKLFWFFAYDRFHRNFPGTAVPTSAATFFAVPQAISASAWTTGYCGSITSTTNYANYQACALASQIATQSTTSANMTAITQAQYATAQTNYLAALFGTSTQPGLISITGPTPRTGDQDILFPKVDWVINQKNHAFVEVNRMRWWSPAGIQTQATNAYGTESFGNDYVKDTWGVAKLDTVVTNTIANQLRIQYGRDFEFENNQAPSAYEKKYLISGTNPYGLPPNVNVGSFQFGTPLFLNRAAYPDEYKFQVADTVTVSYKQHNLRFGIDFMNAQDKINNLYEQYGYFSYSGLPTYFAALQDSTHNYYSNYYQAFQGTSTSTPVKTYQFSTNDWAFFAQDDWKATRRLSVNLGLRFETELLPSQYNDVATTVTIGSQTIHPGTLPANSKNWGPRVGFALDLSGDGKQVVRGGYGVYFGRIINSTIFTGMTTTGSSAGQNTYNIKPTAGGAPVFPNILTSSSTIAGGTLSLDYFDPKFKMPQIHQIDLSFQQQLPGNTVLSVSYLGSLGRHLAQFNDINLAPAGSSYCANAAGAQVANFLSSGACPATYVTSVPGVTPVKTAPVYQVTPPSQVSYSLNNGTLGKAPLSALPGIAQTLPFYTSRLNYSYGSVTDIFSGINSTYNALAIQVERRMTNHLQFSANYTWSHASDWGMNNTTGAGSSNFMDPKNTRFGMHGDSLTNVPNRFTFHVLYDAPWQHKDWTKYVLDGWQIAPVFQVQNGLGNSMSLATAYPSVYVGVTPNSVYTKGVQQFQSIAAGMLGAGGSYIIPGTKRNGYRQDATYVLDLRFSKEFQLYENYKLGISADIFNALNHQNETGVSSTSPYTLTNTAPSSLAVGSTSGPVVSPYGSAISSATGNSLFNVPANSNSNFVYSPRQIQLGVRLKF